MWSSSLIAGDKYAPFSLIATQTAPILQPLLFSIVQMTSISYPELACPALASHSAGARGVKPFVGLAQRLTSFPRALQLLDRQSCRPDHSARLAMAPKITDNGSALVVFAFHAP